MAVGDVTVFEEAKAFMIDGDWNSTDSMAIDLIRVASTPTAADAAPDIGDYTTATTTEGEQVLNTLALCVVEAAGTMTFDDTDATVVWAQGGGNSVDCRWAVIFNTTDAANKALCFIDLGANRDLSVGSITITWNASGIFTIA